MEARTVSGQLDKLHGIFSLERDHGRINRDIIFPEWANCKVIFNAEETEAARQSLFDGSYWTHLRLTTIELREHDEGKRLRAALSVDENGDLVTLCILN